MADADSSTSETPHANVPPSVLVLCTDLFFATKITGTAKALAQSGIPVTEVSEHTGFPEMLDGRVKTLHPKIHGGLLALRENREHMETVAKHAIGLIDMVVVNLYPFERTVAQPGVTREHAIEAIAGNRLARAIADQYPLDGILQFAHVARPRVGHERRHRVGREFDGLCVHAWGMFGDEVRGQLWDVLAPAA